MRINASIIATANMTTAETTPTQLLTKDQRYRLKHREAIQAKDRERKRRAKTAKASNTWPSPCASEADHSSHSQETSTNHYSDTLIMVSKSKAAYWNWVAYRDGSSWAESLFRTYQEAQRDGTTEKFMNNLLIQLAEGKGIMARLHDTIIQPLPRADWEIRDLWRQTFELLILIQDGISAIEMAITYHRVLGLGV